MSGVISTGTMLSWTNAVIRVILCVSTRHAILMSVVPFTANSFVHLWNVGLQCVEQACPSTLAQKTTNKLLPAIAQNRKSHTPCSKTDPGIRITMADREQQTTKIEFVLSTDSNGAYIFTPIETALRYT